MVVATPRVRVATTTTRSSSSDTAIDMLEPGVFVPESSFRRPKRRPQDPCFQGHPPAYRYAVPYQGLILLLFSSIPLVSSSLGYGELSNTAI